MLLKPCTNENGFILVLAMAMLVILSIIGVAGTRTSTIDLKISGNERTMAQEFQIADNLWQLGALWVNSKHSLPQRVNTSIIPGYTGPDALETIDVYKIVRNYGNGGNGQLNDDFPMTPTSTQDGTVQGNNFWYRVFRYKKEKDAGGSDTNYKYPIDVELNVAQRNHIKVRLYKNWDTSAQ